MALMARYRRWERSLARPAGGFSPNSFTRRGSNAAGAEAGSSWARRISPVVSLVSMSTPNRRSHWEGSATPQVCPMPRPPKAPMVAMFSRRRRAAARHQETRRPKASGSPASPYTKQWGMPTSSSAPCMTSPPTGRQPWEPGWVHRATALPLMAKSRTAATRGAAPTQVPEKRTTASTASFFFISARAARASALLAITRGYSTRCRPHWRRAALEAATIFSSTKGAPRGAARPSLCTPYTMKPTEGWITALLLYASKGIEALLQGNQVHVPDREVAGGLDQVLDHQGQVLRLEQPGFGVQADAGLGRPLRADRGGGRGAPL